MTETMSKFSLFAKTFATMTLAALPLLASASSIVLKDHESRDIASYTDFLRMHDNSSAVLSDGGSIGWSAKIYDNATLTVKGGSLRTLWAKGSSNVTIESGAVKSLFTQHNSEVTLANVQGLKHVYVFGDSLLNIQAKDVETFNNNISGLWDDGSAFSFNVYNFTGTFDAVPGNVVISEVPVPASLWLFSSAVMGLAIIGRRRRLGTQTA